MTVYRGPGRGREGRRGRRVRSTTIVVQSVATRMESLSSDSFIYAVFVQLWQKAPVTVRVPSTDSDFLFRTLGQHNEKLAFEQRGGRCGEGPEGRS